MSQYNLKNINFLIAVLLVLTFASGCRSRDPKKDISRQNEPSVDVAGRGKDINGIEPSVEADDRGKNTDYSEPSADSKVAPIDGDQAKKIGLEFMDKVGVHVDSHDKVDIREDKWVTGQPIWRVYVVHSDVAILKDTGEVVAMNNGPKCRICTATRTDLGKEDFRATQATCSISTRYLGS